MARNQIHDAMNREQLLEVWHQFSKNFVMPEELSEAFATRGEEIKLLGSTPTTDVDVLWQQILISAPDDWTTKQIEDHFWTITGAAVDKATAEDMQRYIDAMAAGGGEA